MWMSQTKGRSERSFLSQNYFSISRYPYQLLFLLLTPMLAYSNIEAAVRDITPADVTTRAASVIWASDEPVMSATVHVFADQAGITEITSGLAITLISEQFPPAHDNGIVKVDITGLSPDVSVYIQTETTSGSGTTLSPDVGPFLEIRTAVETTKANISNQPIVNDLIRHPIFAPDGITAAPGTLMLLQAQGVSAYPVSAFVGEGGFAVPDAVVDMNNIFDAAGVSAEIPAEQVLVITEYRGLLCAGLENHKLYHLREAPKHLEVPAITELENPDACYFANTVCDDVIDIADAQAVLNIFNRVRGECVFNPDLDLNSDGVIDIVDFQAVLNQWNQTRPF